MALILTPPFDPNEARKTAQLMIQLLEDGIPDDIDDSPYLPTEEDVHLNLTYLATAWADLILIGLNGGAKPEILIDRSGSMMTTFVKCNDGLERSHGDGIAEYTKMEISIILVTMVADILSKRNEKFDLTQIPVKSWGNKVYDRHPKFSPSLKATIHVRTTLADFHNQHPNELPKIPCTDGTNHQLWFNESDYPLVITDEYSLSGTWQGGMSKQNLEFVANYRNFSWCNAANIIAIGSSGDEMIELQQKTIKIAELATQ